MVDQPYEADIFKKPRSLAKSKSEIRVISGMSGLTQDLILREPMESTYFKGIKRPSKKLKRVIWIDTRSDYEESSYSQISNTRSPVTETIQENTFGETNKMETSRIDKFNFSNYHDMSDMQIE